MQTHGTVSNNDKAGGNEQSFMTSGSPTPMFQQLKHYGVIDKKQKQQLLLRKLGSGERQLYKSFQPEIVESNSGSKQNKKQDLFRSNIETQSQNLLNAYTQNFQISQKDFMNESIQSSFIDEESVAEERQSFATVHKTQPNPHQNKNSGLDFQSVNNEQQEESKEEIASINNEVSVDGYYHVNEESKDESPYDKSQYDDALRQNSGTLKNVKFILFKSQNVKKNFIDKKLAQTSKTPKLVMTQRSRMGNNKDEYFPQSNQYSSLSNSGNNSRLQQSNTVGGTVIVQHNTNSSSSQAMTNSREQQSNELKSVLTTDYGSTKHTFDHQSQKSGQQLQTQLSVKPVQNYEDEVHSDKQQALNQSEDLDQTQNIIATQQMESNMQKQKQISPSKKQEAQKILRQSQQLSKKQSIKLHKKQMLTLDLDIGSPIPKKSQSNSKDQGLPSEKEEELKSAKKILKKTIFDPDDSEFDIHYVKRIPMTARGGEFSTQHFTFELNATDEEENEEDDHDEKRTPKIIENRDLTQSKTLTISSIASRLKKPLHRSKQVSADFDNEFYSQIRNSIEHERQKIAQQKKLASIKVQALSITTKNTPTNTTKKSITFSQKVAVNKKGSSNRLSEDQNSEVDNGGSQNFTQAKTLKQPPAIKPSNLKKGTVATQSTANFTRLNNLEAQTTTVNSLLPPSTSRLGKTTTMKPPLNQIKLGDPKLKSIKTLVGSGAVSPSGALRNKAQANLAFSSQPSSAKNTNSNKIAFPVSVQSNSMETQSPTKKIANQKSGSSFAKSLKSLKQKTSSIQENLGGTFGEDSDSSKIPTQTISLVQDISEPSKFKPPSSTKNSQNKAFFA